MKPRPEGDWPSVTVVVPTRNDRRVIDRCLDAVVAQDYPGPQPEVIVVDNGSTDGTPEVLARYAPRVLILREVRPGVSWARNAAIEAAQGEWIAFTDADCVPRPGWLRTLVDAGRRRDGVSFVGGRIVALPPANAIARFAENLFDQRRSIEEEKPASFISANLLARRDAIVACGMFNPDYPRGQDTELAWRSQKRYGARIAYCDEAVVEHRNPSSITALIHKAWQHGRGSSRLLDEFQAFHGRSLRTRIRQTRPYTDLPRSLWALLPLPRRFGGTDRPPAERRDAFYFALFRCVRQASFVYHSWRRTRDDRGRRGE
jgi:glycosyltransferase involved in cell wall biosynthesis